MKVMFVEAKKKSAVDINRINFSELPEEIFLAYSIQFKEFAEKIKSKLGKRVKGFQQVLGCSLLKSKYPILLVGNGRFHAINLALKGNIVYILENNKINKLNESEAEKIKGRRKAALSKFYAADRLGILVSTKPGQENLSSALKLKEKMRKEKQVSVFLGNNLNLEELENYDIDSWVNTSCQALTFDSRVVNLLDLEN
jgi:diphthamide biosynthesis enzyme Dph1/Dph2-like protein